MKKALIVFALLSIPLAVFAQAPEWPQWRGPNSNGVSSETAWNPLALKDGAKVLWTADIGASYSNVAIQGGRVYATGKDRTTLKLIFSCLDAVTGKKIWEKRDLKTSGEIASTPAVDGDRVYGIGGDGTLFCLRTSDGKIQWQKHLKNDYHLFFSAFTLAVSPIVEGDMLLINANDAGAAVNKRNGRLAWTSIYPSKLASDFYSSPVPFTNQGKRLVLFQGPEFLSAVEPATGKIHWSLPHGMKENIADPVCAESRIFAANNVDAPPQKTIGAVRNAVGVDCSTGTPQIVWKKDGLLPHLTSPVFVSGFVYGINWQPPSAIPYWAWEAVKAFPWNFRCIDQKTGDLRWSQPLKHSTVMAADNKLILLDLEGTLRIVEATPEAYRELCSADVFTGANKPRLFATCPVLCGGRIYCRNYAGDLVCIDAGS